MILRNAFGAVAEAVAIAEQGTASLKSWVRRTIDPCHVNDMHSLLNDTRVAKVCSPRTQQQLGSIISEHHRAGSPLCICGSRHAMGGQQFASGATLVDTRRLDHILDLDTKKGVVHLEAGVEWPDLVDHLLYIQRGGDLQWTIPTKQTGADKLTIGGAIAANAHGRGLTRAPIGADIESFVLVGPDGSSAQCSRQENAELFSLVLGGYGLFGAVYSVKMQLVPRTKLERTVELIEASEVMSAFDRRIAEGYTLGDWQFAIDDASDQFLNLGVFSCYRPVDMSTPIPTGQKKVPMRAWNELVYLAHTEKTRAFKLYADYYMSSNGQIYWSDTSQLGGYDYGYHTVLDKRMGATNRATEMITELYVPRDRFADFMVAAAETIRRNGASVIYGTVRLIEQDTDSFLRWAKESYACVIFNLHVEHAPDTIEQASKAFRELIDLAIERRGSFFLTYHRWATREQVEACYPMFPEFLSKKLQYDPTETFQSDWHRHHKELFGM